VTDQTTPPSSQPVRPGVHVLPGPVADIVARLEREGWRSGFMTGGRDLRGVLRRLGEACDFPHWYGVNLDAAWDCLTDLTEPTVVVWHDWERFAVAQADDFASVMRLWHDRADQAPDFAVVLVT